MYENGIRRSFYVEPSPDCRDKCSKCGQINTIQLKDHEGKWVLDCITCDNWWYLPEKYLD